MKYALYLFSRFFVNFESIVLPVSTFNVPSISRSSPLSSTLFLVCFVSYFSLFRFQSFICFCPPSSQYMSSLSFTTLSFCHSVYDLLSFSHPKKSLCFLFISVSCAIRLHLFLFFCPMSRSFPAPSLPLMCFLFFPTCTSLSVCPLTPSVFL